METRIEKLKRFVTFMGGTMEQIYPPLKDEEGSGIECYFANPHKGFDFNCRNFWLPLAKYDTDLNWLLAVVNKINSLKIPFEIHYIKDVKVRVYFNKQWHTFISATDKEVIFNACYNVIKFLQNV